jgi:dCMP deaminase
MKGTSKLMYMEVAKVIAASSESKKLKVGAIAVNSSGIIGEGYNGTPSGFWTNKPEIDYGENYHNYDTREETIHAEMNLLMKIAKSTNSADGCSVFCTHAPCMKCAIHLHQAGVKEVYYNKVNPFKPDANGLDFLSTIGVKVKELNYYAV